MISPKTKNVEFILGLLLTFCLILLLVRGFIPSLETTLSKSNEIFDFTIEIFAIFITVFMYRDSAPKQLFGILFCIAVVIIFLDTTWYASIAFKNNHDSARIILMFINNLIYIFWSGLVSLFILRVIKKYSLHGRVSLKFILVFFMIDFLLISIFLQNLFVIWHKSAPSIFSIKYFLEFLLQHRLFEFPGRMLLLDASILGLIYAESVAFLAFCFGTTVFSMTYSYFAYGNAIKDKYSIHADMLWTFALIMLLYALLKIYQNKEYAPEKWVRKDNTIRSNIISFCFLFYNVMFFVYFIIAYIYYPMNIEEFLIIPLLYVLYIPFALFAFILLSKVLERPFLQIIKNIEYEILNDKTNPNKDFNREEFQFLQDSMNKSFNNKTKQNKNFKIEEFQFLQDVINKGFEYKNEVAKLKQDKIKVIESEHEKFRKIIGQLVHDMGSPIEAMKSFSNLERTDIVEKDQLNIKFAIKRLSSLTYNLLNKYKNNNYDITEKNLVLIAPIILQIINEKQIEYAKEQINIKLEILDDSYFCSIMANPSMFGSMLSNLINNAIDATISKPERNIKIRLRLIKDTATLFIEDNGVGMPEDIQEKFLQGQSISRGKANGNGIGLSQIYDTINSFGGDLSIYAIKDLGTEIVIKIPLAQKPLWLANQITLNENDFIIILDDDRFIHDTWKNKLQKVLEQYPQLKIRYFLTVENMQSFIDDLTDIDLKQIMFLCDYEILGSKENGLDIIRKNNFKRSILVTNYADNLDIQKSVIESRITLLPKNLLQYIPVSVLKSLGIMSKKVDILWLEDQDFYAELLIKENFSNLLVELYNDPNIFLNDIIYYNCDALVLLDMYYEMPDGKLYDITGIDIAKKIFALGYCNIIILTNDYPEEVIPQFIQIVLKSDKSRIKNILNKTSLNDAKS